MAGQELDGGGKWWGKREMCVIVSTVKALKYRVMRLPINEIYGVLKYANAMVVSMKMPWLWIFD